MCLLTGYLVWKIDPWYEFPDKTGVSGPIWCEMGYGILVPSLEKGSKITVEPYSSVELWFQNPRAGRSSPKIPWVDPPGRL